MYLWNTKTHIVVVFVNEETYLIYTLQNVWHKVIFYTEPETLKPAAEFNDPHRLFSNIPLQKPVYNWLCTWSLFSVVCWCLGLMSPETMIVIMEAFLMWQRRHKAVVWLNERRVPLWNGSVSVAYHVTASQPCLCQRSISSRDSFTPAMHHTPHVIDSWAKGPLAPSRFSSSGEVSSGTEYILQ